MATKQIIAMGVAAFFGVLCFIGLTNVGLIVVFYFDPRIKPNSSLWIRYLILILLTLIVRQVLPLYSSGHMDGSGHVNLMSWSRNC